MFLLINSCTIKSLMLHISVYIMGYYVSIAPVYVQIIFNDLSDLARK